MLNIELKKDENFIFLILEGELDYDYEFDIKNKISLILKEKKDVIIDLTNVHYLDSTAMSIFLSLKKDLNKIKKNLYFYNPQENIKKIFLMTHIDDIIPIIDDSFFKKG